MRVLQHMVRTTLLAGYDLIKHQIFDLYVKVTEQITS